MKKVYTLSIFLLVFCLTGCQKINSAEYSTGADSQMVENAGQSDSEENISTEGVADYPAAINGYTESYNILDYSEFFQGISGCAVIYDEPSNTYSFYNKEKCETEVSPLSTFKIISALAGLENNVLVNETSTMEYSGVKYPVDAWNSNLTLKEAFETSCVWYFRQVVDMVGQEDISTMLEEIQYGNCDISEWNGSATNPLPELNGFWLQSSLKISPKQQVAVLDYIFDRENNFKTENLKELKKLMYIAELDNGCLYGKTGSGIDGKAWFVGFAEENDNRIYFAVYLDDMQNKEIVSGNKAKEIAISILKR
ncbi:MAG: serine hydrolase [Lachnospiraceae bacterium]|nr:serine hydrolase [Lachnospiraceae bacterium]